MPALTETSPPLLQVSDLIVSFGGVSALMNINFEVRRGQIKAVSGPHGAGKTTLFNVITGALAPTEGTVRFNGEVISGLAPHEVAARGISRTFQTVELFDHMTVLENVMVGRHRHISAPFMSCGLRLPSIVRTERQVRQQAMDMLDFVGMADLADAPAGGLPLGKRKILEIGRAMATQPELICLDEPAAGLNETETEAAARLIQAICHSGQTVLLVEHDMQVIMNISDDILVLNYGDKIAEGAPEAIRRHPKVIEAYLGAEAGRHA